VNSGDPTLITLASVGLLGDLASVSSSGSGLSVTEHVNWARARALELGAEFRALKGGNDWGETFAAGAFRDPVRNTVYNAVASRIPGGVLPKGVTLRAGEIAIRGWGHAEHRLLMWGAENGLVPIGIGPSRPHCWVCADLTTHMGGMNAGPLKGGPQ